MEQCMNEGTHSAVLTRRHLFISQVSFSSGGSNLEDVKWVDDLLIMSTQAGPKTFSTRIIAPLRHLGPFPLLTNILKASFLMDNLEHGIQVMLTLHCQGIPSAQIKHSTSTAQQIG